MRTPRQIGNASRVMILLASFTLLLIGIFLHAPRQTWAQDSWCVYEKTIRHAPPENEITSRQDWISVAKCKEAPQLSFHFTYLIDQLQPRDMSWDVAAASADYIALTQDLKFRMRRCCPWWKAVWRSSAGTPGTKEWGIAH